MAAYLAGQYAETVSRLGEWIDAGRAGPAYLEEIAIAALSSLNQLVDERNREAIVGASSELLEKIGRPSPGSSVTAAVSRPE